MRKAPPRRIDHAALREEKVKMYKEKKALEKCVDQFDAIDQPNVDEEVLVCLILLLLLPALFIFV